MEKDEESKNNDDKYQCHDIVESDFLLLARNQQH
jgi:hypothetical protein